MEIMRIFVKFVKKKLEPLKDYVLNSFLIY